jgi:hypothetical protein
MGLAKRVIGALLITGAAALSLPPSGCAQERVGIVTNLEGTATVARLALPQPLRFKDGVHLHDRITTGERSIVRVLLGGKATVTARERSVLTITEGRREQNLRPREGSKRLPGRTRRGRAGTSPAAASGCGLLAGA